MAAVTLCHTTSEAEDLAQLEALTDSPPETVLVVSDLHLGEGLDPASGQVAPTENFVQDGPFARFLEAHHAQAQDAALLVLNGDIIDFPRITRVPRTSTDFEAWRRMLGEVDCHKTCAELDNSVSNREQRFGLRTNDFKVVWKLDRVVRGHPVFFEALAAWVSAGGSLLFVKGNHDLEIEHALVRRALRAAIQRSGAGPEAVHARVAFCMDGLRLDNAWIEHGHQHEAMTRVIGPAFLEGRSDELNQPLGTFVNRYLLNPIEHMRPFLNNIKPVQGVLWKLLKHHPVKALGVVMRSSWFVPRAIAMSRFRQLLGVLLFSLFVIGGWVVGLGVSVLLVGLAFGGFADFAATAVRLTAVALLLGFAAPVAAGALGDIADRLRRRRVAPYVRDCLAAARRARLGRRGYRVSYVIVGHTHVQDSQRPDNLTADAAPTLYLNTGTWIPIWSDHRPDLHGRTLRPFVQLHRDAEATEYRHRHLQWNDDRGTAQPSLVYGVTG